MKSPLPFLVLFVVAVASSCGTAPAIPSDSPRPSSTPTVIPKPSNNGASPVRDMDPDTQSRIIVAFDRGEKTPASSDDIAVKRVRYLLGVLIAQTKETPFNIAFGVDHASEVLENKYGKKVTRQQLLEEMATAYSNKTIEAKNGPFKDAVLLWAIMKHGN